ncbi:MAG: hypothetical protein R3D98_00555 [Candidatus Krumholzibacteriia bacterium]
MRIVVMITLLVLALAAAAPADTACRVYFTEWNSYNPDLSRIARANLDGSGLEVLATGFSEGTGVQDLVIDQEAAKIYWANRSAGLIERADLDGSDRETVVSGINPVGLALDAAGGKIYWTDYTYNNPTIRRADLDGTDAQVLHTCTAGCVLEGIVLDPAGASSTGQSAWIRISTAGTWTVAGRRGSCTAPTASATRADWPCTAGGCTGAPTNRSCRPPWWAMTCGPWPTACR